MPDPIPVLPADIEGKPAGAFDSLLRAQYEQVGINLRAVWDLYIKFYVMFITVNFTAVGLTVQYIDLSQRAPLAITFICQNIISGATALGMGAYSRYALRQQQAVIDAACLDTAKEAHPLAYLSPVPVKLTSWSGIANFIGHILFIICWYWVGWKLHNPIKSGPVSLG